MKKPVSMGITTAVAMLLTGLFVVLFASLVPA